MMKFSKIFLAFFLLAPLANAQVTVRGFNLTEVGDYLYDAAPAGATTKTPAQLAVDGMKRLGVNHVVLNPRAKMIGPYSSEIIPFIGAREARREAERYARLIAYIRAQGMTVGIRPIFFVFGPNNEFPYFEDIPGVGRKVWWHGNIQPRDPNAWFSSFKDYLRRYLNIARENRAEEFTIGAELYSMTVGVEDQWLAYPYGFPGRWREVLTFAETMLRDHRPNCRIMYDINFTDDRVDGIGGVPASGGELERWRYRLVDLANPSNPDEHVIWTDLMEFWKALDAVGIDMYRSLANRGDEIPTEFEPLVGMLKVRADAYAGQIDQTFYEIEGITTVQKRAILKEVGYRSVDQGFIDPFSYAEFGTGRPSILHQAAAYEALFRAFWPSEQGSFPWFAGAAFWDVSVDPNLQGPMDTGFSPLGKPLTEELIQRRFLPAR